MFVVIAFAASWRLPAQYPFKDLYLLWMKWIVFGVIVLVDEGK